MRLWRRGRRLLRLRSECFDCLVRSGDGVGVSKTEWCWSTDETTGSKYRYDNRQIEQSYLLYDEPSMSRSCSLALDSAASHARLMLFELISMAVHVSEATGSASSNYILHSHSQTRRKFHVQLEARTT